MEGDCGGRGAASRGSRSRPSASPANRADLFQARGAGDCRQVCERKKYGFDPDTVICHEECPYSSKSSGYSGGSGPTWTQLWLAGAIVVGIVLVLFVAASRSKPSTLGR